MKSVTGKSIIKIDFKKNCPGYKVGNLDQRISIAYRKGYVRMIEAFHIFSWRSASHICDSLEELPAPVP